MLFILVGSDVTLMERLASHDRPLYGRAEEMVVQALTPSEVGEAGRRDPFDVFSLYLETGAYPRLVGAANHHDRVQTSVHEQLGDEQSPL